MFKEFLAFATIVVVVVFLLLVGLIRGLNELDVVGSFAKIEQLRSDVQKIDSRSNEDVIGQVTEWNQTIRSCKQYREKWWGRIGTPEEWEDVELIELPQ